MEKTPIRVYGRSELAQLYYGRPISDRGARMWFMKELSHVPGLMERLRELGFTPRSKIFSRAQVKAIFEALGEPCRRGVQRNLWERTGSIRKVSEALGTEGKCNRKMVVSLHRRKGREARTG